MWSIPAANAHGRARAQGWNVAFQEPAQLIEGADALDSRVVERISGELSFLDGATWQRIRGLTKPVRRALAAEKHVLSVDNPRFLYGTGVKTLV